MMLKTLATVAAAAGLLALTAGVPTAQAQPGPDNGHSWVYKNGQWEWVAQLNVKQSERYHSLLEHDRAFREARMRKECGPITDPTLHQRCLQSFAEFSPYGTSTPTYATLGGGANYGSTNGPSYGSSAGSNYGTGTNGTDNGQ